MSVNEKMTAIADAIRVYTGSEATMGLDAMAANIESVHIAGYNSGWDQGMRDGQAFGRQEGYADGKAAGIEEGKQAEYDAFWDAYQDYGNRKDYQNGFSGKGWNTKTFKPKHHITVTNGYMMFRYNSAEVDLVQLFEQLGVVFDDSRNTNPAYMYFGSGFTRIGTVTLSEKSTGDMFNGCNNLVTIDKIISKASTTYTNSNFLDCPKLENVTFEGVIGKSINFADSPLLTNASVQSIIDCLKDLTGATAQTLTLHADVGAKLTDEQKATITAKNWTLVY